MTVSENLIITMICGYTILIGNYYQKNCGWISLRLTCKYNDGGCNLIQMHCFRWITNVPLSVSDEFFHAIVKPWTVKHMKVVYNSTGYQMVEKRSSWKGPDTIALIQKYNLSIVDVSKLSKI